MSIKRKPWWIRLFVADWRWITITPNIYAADIYWTGPGPQWQPLIAHEYVHLARQQERGFWSWAWRYLTDDDFRLMEEARGMAVEIEETTDTERKLFLLDDYSKQLCAGYMHAAASPGVARAAIAQFLNLKADPNG